MCGGDARGCYVLEVCNDRDFYFAVHYVLLNNLRGFDFLVIAVANHDYDYHFVIAVANHDYHYVTEGHVVLCDDLYHDLHVPARNLELQWTS